MNFGTAPFTAPAAEPITLADAKLHLRVDGDDEDSLIESLVVAARRWIEQTHGLALVTQTWDGALARFPRGSEIMVPKYPLVSVTSITYHDDDLSTSTVFSSSSYQVDTRPRPPRIVLKNGSSWPTDSLRLSSGVVVRAVFGFGDPVNVPPGIVHAMRLLVANMYEHREPEVTGTIVAEVDFAVDALLAPYRLFT